MVGPSAWKEEWAGSLADLQQYLGLSVFEKVTNICFSSRYHSFAEEMMIEDFDYDINKRVYRALGPAFSVFPAPTAINKVPLNCP